MSAGKNFIFFLLCFLVIPGTHVVEAMEKGSVPLRPIDTLRVSEIAGLLNAQPGGFGDPITDRKRWEELLQSGYYDTFLRTMERFSFPPFDESDYFSLSNGTASSSARGLNMMRDRANALAKLTIAECLENKGSYIRQIEDGLRDMIRQKSWVSPRSDYDFINYNGKQYTIDLTSALYAHTIAQTLYLLNGEIDKSLRKEAVEALYVRVFRPLLTIFEEQSTRYHSWLTGTNNWNAVCLSGVIGAALTVIPDKEERALYAYIGEHYSRNTLAGFGDDGYCSEGVTYFNYGFLHYAMLRENLWLATKGKIDLFTTPKVREIALYIPRLEIVNGVYPAISDSKPGSQPDSLLMSYLSRSLGLGLDVYERIPSAGKTRNNRLDVMMAFPNSTESVPAVGSRKSQEEWAYRSYFEQSGILVTRPGHNEGVKLATALKGGHNHEHHNHNDVGSYTVVVGNSVVAGDPGSIPYTADIFKAQFRYTYKSVSSYGHPVPLVAGVQQVPGVEAKAKVLNQEFTPSRDVFLLDLKQCYEVPFLERLEREFIYERVGKGVLRVVDKFGFSKPDRFETAWVTRSDFREISKGKWLVNVMGEDVEVVVDTGGLPFKTAIEEISEGGIPYKRIGISLEGEHKAGIVRLVYTAL